MAALGRELACPGRKAQEKHQRKHRKHKTLHFYLACTSSVSTSTIVSISCTQAHSRTP